MTLCPACGAGRLTEHVEQMPAEWEGRSEGVHGLTTTPERICCESSRSGTVPGIFGVIRAVSP